MSIELEHLAAALEEAEQVVAQSERLHASTEACAWWHSCVVLRRFMHTPRRLPGIRARRLDLAQKRPASPLI